MTRAPLSRCRVCRVCRVAAGAETSGAAIFTLRVKPAEQVEVTLDTSEPAAAQLRPLSPRLKFVAEDYDDFVVLDQSFSVEKKVVHYVPKPDSRPNPL